MNPRLAAFLLLGLAGCTSVPERPKAPYFVRVVGYSMHPTIANGQSLLMLPIKLEELHGWMIVDRSKPSGARVLHRVDHVDGCRVFTKGDWNLQGDYVVFGPHVLRRWFPFSEVNGYWPDPRDPRTWIKP